MRQSEVRQAFQEFLRLQSIVNTGNLEHEDNVQARVDLWEQVRILREQVEAYRQAGHELLSAEEQQALDAVQCARVLTTSERAQELIQDQVRVQSQEIPW